MLLQVAAVLWQTSSVAPAPYPGINGQTLAVVQQQASAGQEDQLAGALPCCLAHGSALQPGLEP